MLGSSPCVCDTLSIHMHTHTHTHTCTHHASSHSYTSASYCFIPPTQQLNAVGNSHIVAADHVQPQSNDVDAGLCERDGRWVR